MTTILASVIGGNVATSDGILYLLTACCNASGKGSSNSPTGVCCRACYQPVPERFGWGALVSDPNAVASLAAQFPVLGHLATDFAESVVTKAQAINTEG